MKDGSPSSKSPGRPAGTLDKTELTTVGALIDAWRQQPRNGRVALLNPANGLGAKTTNLPRVPANARFDGSVTFAQVFMGFPEEVPSSLLPIVSSATDPLEVAASLESCGLSNAVVRERFGEKDVFSLARKLYDAVEFRAASADDLRVKRSGGLPDLGRGLVFAAPTLMFAGAALGLCSWVQWWTVPLALIFGWAFGQFVSYVGFSREAADLPAGPAVVWALLASLVCTVGLGLAGDAILGGTCTGLVFAAAACAFMTVAAELIVHSEERLIGFILLPGAVGSLVFITHEPFRLPVTAAVALAGASIAATAVAALRRLPRRWWRVPVLRRGDVPVALRYFASGACCGFFVSLFMVLEPAGTGSHVWPAAAAYPMVLSLGIMEWQLRTLRSSARKAMLGSHGLTDFVRAVRKRLAQATLRYMAALAALTCAVQLLAYACGVTVPVPLSVAGGCLAVAFFLALVVASCGRIDLVLNSWLASLAIFGVLATLARLARLGSPDFSGTGLAFCLAAVAAVASLSASARRAAVNPFSYT